MYTTPGRARLLDSHSLLLLANPNTKPRYPGNFTRELKSLLRPNVLYITVSQSDCGLPGPHNQQLAYQDIPNVVVLSAGGCVVL